MQRIFQLLVTGLSVFGFYTNANSNQDPATSTTQPRATASSHSLVESDTEITRKIREELMKKDISTAAKNVTISTNAGKVTLSGDVANTRERTAVYETAAAVAGRPNIRNELTVTQ